MPVSRHLLLFAWAMPTEGYKIYFSESDDSTGVEIPKHVATKRPFDFYFRINGAGGVRKHNATHATLPLESDEPLFAEMLQTDHIKDVTEYRFRAMMFGYNPQTAAFPVGWDMDQDKSHQLTGENPNRYGAAVRDTVIRRVAHKAGKDSKLIFDPPIETLRENNKKWEQSLNETEVQKRFASAKKRNKLVSLYTVMSRYGTQGLNAALERNYLEMLSKYLGSDDASTAVKETRFETLRQELRGKWDEPTNKQMMLEAGKHYVENGVEGMPNLMGTHHACWHLEAHPQVNQFMENGRKQLYLPLNTPLLAAAMTEKFFPKRTFDFEISEGRFFWDDTANSLEFVGQGRAASHQNTFEMPKNAPKVTLDEGYGGLSVAQQAATISEFFPTATTIPANYYVISPIDGEGELAQKYPVASADTREPDFGSETDAQMVEIFKQLQDMEADFGYPMLSSNEWPSLCSPEKFIYLEERVKRIDIPSLRWKTRFDSSYQQTYYLAEIVGEALECMLNFLSSDLGPVLEINSAGSVVSVHTMMEATPEFSIEAFEFVGWRDWKRRQGFLETIYGSDHASIASARAKIVAPKHGWHTFNRNPDLQKGLGSLGSSIMVPSVQAQNVQSAKPHAEIQHLFCNTLGYNETQLTFRHNCEPDADSMDNYCLMIDNAQVMNLRMASDNLIYPRMDDTLSDFRPKSVEITADRSRIFYDKSSILEVDDLGKFYGSNEVGTYYVAHYTNATTLQGPVEFNTYRGVSRTDPQEWQSPFSLISAAPATNTIRQRAFRQRILKSETTPSSSVWPQVLTAEPQPVTITRKYYPCSMIVKKEYYHTENYHSTGNKTVKILDRVKTTNEICTAIMNTCTGSYTKPDGQAVSLQQFSSKDECITYYSSLPEYDQTCASDSPSGESFRGRSLMCKYLSYFSLENAPERHCFYGGRTESGGLGEADVFGDSQCSPTDCAGRSGAPKNVEQCTEKDEEDITTATILALPWCLKRITGVSSDCDKHCTQAVNLFFGRLVESGMIDSCAMKRQKNPEIRSPKSVSALLRVLDIDARTLLGLTSRCSLFAPYTPDAVYTSQMPHLYSIPATTCLQPNQYISRSGCRTWNWNSLISTFDNEWSYDSQATRITTSDYVARAEINTMVFLMTEYYDLERWPQLFPFLAQQKRDLFGAFKLSPRESIKFQLRPKDAHGPIVLGGPDYHKVLRSGFDRKHNVFYDKVWYQELGPKQHFYTFITSDNTPESRKRFIATLRLFETVIDPVGIRRKLYLDEKNGRDPYAFPGEKSYVLPTVYLGSSTKHGSLLAEKLDDIEDQVIFFLSNRLFQPKTIKQAESYYMYSRNALLPLLTRDERESRNWGHMPHVGHEAAGEMAAREMNRTDEWTKAAQKFLTDAKSLGMNLKGMESNPVGNPPELSVENVLRNALYPAGLGIGHLKNVITFLINFIRRYECEVLPIFHQDPFRVIAELQRMADDIMPILKVADDEGATIIGGHNTDGDIFPNPFKFDATRTNMGEADFQNIYEKHVPQALSMLRGKDFHPNTIAAGLASGQISDPAGPLEVYEKTHVRTCPGRWIAQDLMYHVVSKYVRTKEQLNGKCYAGSRVINGVRYVKEETNLKYRVGKNGKGDEMDRVGKMTTFVAMPNDDDDDTINPLTTDKDSVTEAIVFFHGFPHIPQSWSKIIAKFRTHRPEAVFIAASLPGLLENENGLTASGIRSCKFSEDPEKLSENYIRSLHERWPNVQVYLVGHDIGAILAWRLTQKLSTVNYDNGFWEFLLGRKKAISGLISFAPHPHLMFSMMENKLAAKKVPFYSLLNPLIGEALLSAKNFEALQDIVRQGDTWHNDTDRSLEMEYRRQWKVNGARRMTCYFRDNFYVKVDDDKTSDTASSIHSRDSDWESINLVESGNVMMIRGETDLFQPKDMFMYTFPFLEATAGHTWMLRTISGANATQLLFNDKVVEEVVHGMDIFVEATQRIKFSMNAWLPLAPRFFGGVEELFSHDGIAIPFAVATATVAVIAGLSLEVYLGPIILNIEHKEAWWRFGQIVMVPLGLAALASGSWLGIPIFFSALFKFGFPEVTTLLRTPFLSSSWISWQKKAVLFVDGVGCLLHHSGSSVIYACRLSHIVGSGDLIMVIPLMGQHVGSALKYVSEPVYVVTLTLLEAWFQLEVYYIMCVTENAIAYTGLFILVLAHWIWLFNGFVFSPILMSPISSKIFGSAALQADMNFSSGRASMVIADGPQNVHKHTRASLFMDQNWKKINNQDTSTGDSMFRKPSGHILWNAIAPSSIINKISQRLRSVRSRSSFSFFKKDSTFSAASKNSACSIDALAEDAFDIDTDSKCGDVMQYLDANHATSNKHSEKSNSDVPSTGTTTGMEHNSSGDTSGTGPTPGAKISGNDSSSSACIKTASQTQAVLLTSVDPPFNGGMMNSGMNGGKNLDNATDESEILDDDIEMHIQEHLRRESPESMI